MWGNTPPLANTPLPPPLSGAPLPACSHTYYSDYWQERQKLLRNYISGSLKAASRLPRFLITYFLRNSNALAFGWSCLPFSLLLDLQCWFCTCLCRYVGIRKNFGKSYFRRKTVAPRKPLVNTPLPPKCITFPWISAVLTLAARFISSIIQYRCLLSFAQPFLRFLFFASVKLEIWFVNCVILSVYCIWLSKQSFGLLVQDWYLMWPFSFYRIHALYFLTFCIHALFFDISFH